ncbi:hypothetical protein SAMN05421678_113144 [Actinopolymorpha cephalotaxi]|uniref:Uncharacterized protein n=1 Tax=Actinopolymorpha cephalotaxi TaxID=504797 RepID=A0A1I2Y0M5_9ACTN|nr:hypothetical protein [Actinopolymorpha cephalotaxi]NYH87264.1 hypothetical protein [Actinopolymorpha cephalotaxi]SFH18897.1 hypothetical protein SAMN05421678_113144 [Actinopolymorpha cephalotaxi]
MRRWTKVCAGVVAAAVPAGVGGALGALAGGRSGLVAGLAAGGVPGAAFGWAVAAFEPYDLTSVRGITRYVADLTWSLPNTWLGAVLLTGNLLAGNRVVAELSRHGGTVHLAGRTLPAMNGVRYVTTVGTVVAGIAAPAATPAARALLAHERGHVLQARLFGPAYVPSVLVNYAAATVLPLWWLWHDHARYPIRSVAAYFQYGVYPHVWNEEWCYRVYGPRR